MSARRQQSTRRVGRIERLEPRQLLAVDTVLDFSIPRDLPPGHDVFAAIWGQKQSDNEYLVLQQQAQRPGDYAFVPVSPVSLPQPINVSTLTDTQLRLPLTAVESAGFGGIVGGVVVLFVAPAVAPPDFPLNGSNEPTVPTVSTNAGDLFGLFEWAYPESGGSYALDIDLSEVDQISFPITVATTPASTAPYPLAEVGIAPSRETLFARFQSAFPEGVSPFAELLPLGREADGSQIRLVAPQTALGLGNTQGPAPSHSVTAGSSPFPADTPFYYLVTATSGTGETMAGAAVTPALTMNNLASATLSWEENRSPQTTGYRLYRGAGTIQGSPTSGTPVEPASLDDYELIYEGGQTSFTDSFSAQLNDDTPPLNGYGFDPLSEYFTTTLQEFFDHYESVSFEFVVPNVGPDSEGTKWQGNVVDDHPAVAHAGAAGGGSTGTIVLDVAALPVEGIYDGLEVTIDPGGAGQETRTVQTSTYDPVSRRHTLRVTPDWTTAPAAGTPYEITGRYRALVLSAAEGYLHAVGPQNESATFAILEPIFSTNTKGISGLSPMPDWVNAGGGVIANYTMSPAQMVFAQLGVFASNAIDPAIAADNGFLDAAQLGGLERMVGAVENAVSTAFNRGLATQFTLAPDAWATAQAFSQPPASARAGVGSGELTAGTDYYYVITAVDADGNESTPGRMVRGTVAVGDDGIRLAFGALPATPPAGKPFQGPVYQSFNVYRSTSPDLSAMRKLYVLTNRTTPGFSEFTDFGTGYDYAAGNQSQVTPVTLPSAQTAPPHVFYAPGSTANDYAEFLHRNASFDPVDGVSINGLVYGFPYDDNGGNSTNIGYTAGNNPQSLEIAINPWTAAADVREVVSGDFNGDGLTDVAQRRIEGTRKGQWWVTYTAETGLPETELMRGWSTLVEWNDIVVADLSGDGRDDIAGRASNGQWWLLHHDGNGWTNTLLEEWSTLEAWFDVVVGDFDADGRDDILARTARSTWWMLHYDPATEGYQNTLFGQWSTTTPYSQIVVGDFDGGGRSMLAGRAAASGMWWGQAYQGTPRAMRDWSLAVSWREAVAGDFNGDGIDDIAGLTDGNVWYVLVNAAPGGWSWSNGLMKAWSRQEQWRDITVADFTGDGADDIAARVAANGSWYVLRRESAAYANVFFGGAWSAADTWAWAFAGRYDTSGRAGLLGRSTGDAWRKSLSSGTTFATTSPAGYP